MSLRTCYSYGIVVFLMLNTMMMISTYHVLVVNGFHNSRITSISSIPAPQHTINMIPPCSSYANYYHHHHHHGHDHSRLLLNQLRAGSSDGIISLSNHHNTHEESLGFFQRQRERQRAIYAILISTTLNLLGFTLTSPLNPALGSHFNLPLGASFGSLTSAYPAGMLLGQLVWARMSDFIGRKRILSISLLGGGIGLGLQSMSIWSKSSLHIFLATRVFTGIFSGVAPVAKAYLADLGDEVERSGKRTSSSSSSEQGLVAKYLGWRDAASTLAYIVGPALGGILFELVKDSSLSVSPNETGALAFVIGIAGLASIIASGCISMFVREEFKPNQSLKQIRQPSKHTEFKSKEESNIEAAAEKSYECLSCPLGSQLWTGVATVCVISFLYHVSDSTFFAFYPALLQNQFGLDARAVGISFTGFACISFMFSAMSLSSKMIEKVGVVNTCVAGLTSLGTGLTALSFLGVGLKSVSIGVLKAFTWISAAVYFSGVPLYGPTVPLMLLMCVPSHQRGAIMGLDGAVNTIARIISPIIMGDVYRRGGSQLTFRLAGAAAFASAGIASLRRLYVHRRAKQEITKSHG
jgi:MFS family permease